MLLRVPEAALFFLGGQFASEVSEEGRAGGQEFVDRIGRVL